MRAEGDVDDDDVVMVVLLVGAVEVVALGVPTAKEESGLGTFWVRALQTLI